MYTGVFGSWTDHARPCTRSDPYTPCTCTNCVHGRTRAIHTLRTPPCTRAVNTAVYTAVNTAVYTVTGGPCTWPVRSLYTAVDGRIHRPQTRACTRYTAAYTGRKHGRVQGTRPCTRACSAHGRTMHGRVHGTYTAVHTGRKDGRVDGTARTRPVHGTAVYTVRRRSGTGRVPGRVLPRTGCVHGRVRETNGPCAWPVYGRVHSLYTAEGGGAQSCTGHVHGPSVTVYTAVFTAVNTAVYRVHDRVGAPCTRTWDVAVFTARVHGGVRTVYMAVYTAVHGVYGLCTPACKDRVHGASTAMYRYTYTVGYSVHGLVYGPCTRPLTAHGPSVTRSRPCTRPVHGRVP